MSIKEHLIMGEKGGVGKSELALALVDYYTQKDKQIVVCEADRSNGETGPAIEGKNGHTVIYPYFSEDPTQTSGADEVLDAAIENGVATIIDCPAQSLRPIAKWVADGSIDIAVEEGIEPYFWFVTNGQRSSMGLLLESIKAFPHTPHILVRNHFMIKDLTYDYSDPERNPEVARVLKEQNIPVINFPCFYSKDIEYRKSGKLTFLEAIEDRPGSQRASRSRIRSRLKEFFSELETLPLFSPTNGDQRNEQPAIPNTPSSTTAKPTATASKKTRSTRKSTGAKKRTTKSKNLGDSQ